MRSIKFRAFINGEMIYDLAYRECTPINDVLEGTENLMQFTGLFDRQGIEIYEGDICKCWGGTEFNGYYEYNKIYEVKWQGNGFDMVKNNCGYGWGLTGAIDIIEVIGNIYENKELLKGD